LKDQDFHKQIRLHRDVALESIEQIHHDVEFLKKQNIMDYSLLVGIHNCTQQNTDGRHCNGLEYEPIEEWMKIDKNNKSSDGATTPTTTTTTKALPLQDVVADNGTDHENQGQGAPDSPSIKHDINTPTKKENIFFAPQITPPESEDTKSNRTSQTSHTKGLSVNDTIARPQPLTSAQSPLFPTSPSSLTEQGPRPLRARVIMGPGIYHLGIIDMLQTWDWRKKGEQWLYRILGHWSDYKEMSAVEPNWYGDRFMGMLERVIELPPEYLSPRLSTSIVYV